MMSNDQKIDETPKKWKKRPKTWEMTQNGPKSQKNGLFFEPFSKKFWFFDQIIYLYFSYMFWNFFPSCKKFGSKVVWGRCVCIYVLYPVIKAFPPFLHCLYLLVPVELGLVWVRGVWWVQFPLNQLHCRHLLWSAFISGHLLLLWDSWMKSKNTIRDGGSTAIDRIVF